MRTSKIMMIIVPGGTAGVAAVTSTRIAKPAPKIAKYPTKNAADGSQSALPEEPSSEGEYHIPQPQADWYGGQYLQAVVSDPGWETQILPARIATGARSSMKLSKVIAFLIWMAWVPAWVHAAITSPQNVPISSPWSLLLPVVGFTACPFLIRRDPIDVPPLREWIDNRLGDGSYAGFIRNLKPMLLLGLSAIAAGLLGFGRNLQVNAPLDAYWTHAFILCGGLGMLFSRAVLARRRLSMESTR